jgi:hypothetical protein
MTLGGRLPSRLIEVVSLPDERENELAPCRAPCHLAAIRKATARQLTLNEEGKRKK